MLLISAKVDGEFEQRLIAQCKRNIVKLRGHSRERLFVRARGGNFDYTGTERRYGPSLPAPYIVHGLFYSRYFAFYYFRLAN